MTTANHMGNAGVSSANGYPQYQNMFSPEMVQTLVRNGVYRSAIMPLISATDPVTANLNTPGHSDTVYFPREMQGVKTRPRIKDGQLVHDTVTVDYCSVRMGSERYYSIKVDQGDYMQVTPLPMMINDAIEATRRDFAYEIDCSALATMFAEAHCHNAGKNAGAVSRNIDLGTAAAPVAVNSANVADFFLRAQQVFAEQNTIGGQPYAVTPIALNAVIARTPLATGSYMYRGDTSLLDFGNSDYKPSEFFGTSLISTPAIRPFTLGGAPIYKVLFGYKSATAFSGIAERTRNIDHNPDNFDQHFQGIFKYGYAVLRPRQLAAAYITIT